MPSLTHLHPFFQRMCSWSMSRSCERFLRVLSLSKSFLHQTPLTLYLALKLVNLARLDFFTEEEKEGCFPSLQCNEIWKNSTTTRSSSGFNRDITGGIFFQVERARPTDKDDWIESLSSCHVKTKSFLFPMTKWNIHVVDSQGIGRQCDSQAAFLGTFLENRQHCRQHKDPRGHAHIEPSLVQINGLLGQRPVTWLYLERKGHQGYHRERGTSKKWPLSIQAKSARS